jgi:TolB protein
LSPGSLDESPSFAPNASMVLYAAREGGRGVLYAVSADARVRQRLVLAERRCARTGLVARTALAR